MLDKHQSMWKGGLSQMKETGHWIALKPNTLPIHQKPFRCGTKSQTILDDQIQLQVAVRGIKPTQSELGSRIVVNSKHDSSLRCFEA